MFIINTNEYIKTENLHMNNHQKTFSRPIDFKQYSRNRKRTNVFEITPHLRIANASLLVSQQHAHIQRVVYKWMHAIKDTARAQSHICNRYPQMIIVWKWIFAFSVDIYDTAILGCNVCVCVRCKRGCWKLPLEMHIFPSYKWKRRVWRNSKI